MGDDTEAGQEGEGDMKISTEDSGAEESDAEDETEAEAGTEPEIGE